MSIKSKIVVKKNCASLVLVTAFSVMLGISAEAEKKEKQIVVCSTTQVADFTREVVGDLMDVRCILSSGMNPHGYLPVPRDSRLVELADLCLQNGLHLEGKNWMGSLARDNGNKPLISCTDGVLPLDLMYEGRMVKDPHAWFDPRNAAIYVNNIVDAVCGIDPANAEDYQARADLYLKQLRVLDAWIDKQVLGIPRERRVLVTSHDAFNYFASRYGFTVRSPVGWSTGTEVGGGMTPESRRRVIESIREFNVPAVFFETSVNPKTIRQIASEAGVNIGGELYSDAMGEEGSAGETYIGMMRENALTICRALGGG